MSSPDVTILIPVYVKDAHQVARLIMAAKSAAGWPVVIADDHSGRALPDLPGVEATITRHRQTMGPGAARNTGLTEVQTPYVLPLDADDQLMPGAVEALLAAARPDRIVYGDVLLGQVRHRQQVELYPLICGLNVPTVTALYPTEAVRQAGGWPEHMGGLEDVDLWISLLERGLEPYHVERTIFAYNKRPDGRNARMNSAALWAEVRQRHGETWGKAMACKCGQNRGALPETPIANPAFVQYSGKRASPFGYRGPATGRHYHVVPGEVLPVDQDDRQPILDTGLFEPATPKQGAAVRDARRESWLWTLSYLGDSMDAVERAVPDQGRG